MLIRKKRCEIANSEEFPIESLCKLYIFLEHLNRRIILCNDFLKKVWKKVWNRWEKVWNRNYIEIFNAKPIEYIYILVAFKYEDYKVKKYFEKGVKKGVKSPKKVWNRWYRGIFRWNPMQTLYILVALNQAVFMV